MSTTAITGIGRLFTASEVGVIEDAVVVIRDGTIIGFGPRAQLDVRTERVIDAEGALVTPGLIDAHTHPVYAGARLAEIAARTAGVSYAELGEDAGIRATVAATRATAADELQELVRARLRRWISGGATTVETKTGYHLEREGELAAVRLLSELRSDPQLPQLYVTFLAAHAVPRGVDRARYAAESATWAMDAVALGASGVDVFCDEGYFTVEEARRVLQTGARAGLVPRLHADELARTGGAQLAAELGAASADHLLHVTGEDARALAEAGVAATVCPVTAMSMGQRPDVGALREAGVTIALGSDHNPGTSGVASMSLIVGLAVAGLGLSVDEALTAATAGGARSLRLPARGRVRRGAQADLVVWQAEHEGAFAWELGTRPRTVVIAGRPVEVPTEEEHP